MTTATGCLPTCSQ